jgi:hypothetical protein
MGNRLWIGGAILLAGLFFWGVGYVVTPENGDAEFQKMLEAMKQVKSFRGTFVGSTPNTRHSERLWEVDCNRSIVHKRSQDLPNGPNAVDTTDDQFFVGSDQKFTRTSDGSWEKSQYTSVAYSAKWYCENLPQGTLRDLLPDVRALLQSATFGKGDKKTVDGVRCQDWKFTNHSRNSGQRGTVCIGLGDHLPYEMTIDNSGRYSYTDYNRPLELDAPEAVLEAASSTDGSN